MQKMVTNVFYMFFIPLLEYLLINQIYPAGIDETCVALRSALWVQLFTKHNCSDKP